MRLSDVNVLHYALLREKVQRAKCRMYCMIEAINGTRNLFGRRAKYTPNHDYSVEGPVEPVPEEWLTGWEQQGVDMRSVEDSEQCWQNDAVLQMIAEHGERRFWNDCIWDHDWNRMLADAKSRGAAASTVPNIVGPSRVRQLALGMGDWAYSCMRELKRRVA